MKIIAGVLDYINGKLYIDGKNMKDVPPYKRDISMMLETYAVFPQMNVFNNVAFGLNMMGKIRIILSERLRNPLNSSK